MIIPFLFEIMRFSSFIGSALLLVCALSASAAEYSVKSVSELKILSSGLVPGDVVVWENGSYDSVVVKFNANGTAESPVVLKARTPGGVEFTGASSVTIGGSFVVAEGFAFRHLDTSSKASLMVCARGSHSCRFSDCLIDGTGSEVSTVDSKWVSLYGSENEISHCTFEDKRNMGTLMVVWMEDGVAPAHRILNNSFTRPYTHLDENGRALNGQETIRIGTSEFSLNDACCRVEGNFFLHCHGEKAEIISNKSCGNVYDGNLFVNSSGSLTLRHGNSCVVRNNIFFGKEKEVNDAGGVRIIGENHIVEDNVMIGLRGKDYKAPICTVLGEKNAAKNGYWTVKNVQIRRNVLIGCKNGMCLDFGTRPTQTEYGVKVKIKDNREIPAGPRADAEASAYAERIGEIMKNSGRRW